MLRALVLTPLLLAASCGTVATQAPPPRKAAQASERRGLFPADSLVRKGGIEVSVLS